jgi:Gas vesicle synthesis protein GvpL/GvpF
MIYVYGFLSARPPIAPPSGVSGEPVELRSLGPLVVATGELSEVPPAELDALRRHDAVVRALARPPAAILPARFGSICATDAELGAWVEPRLSLLQSTLRLVEGCEQMTVRIFAPRGTPSPDAESEAGSNDIGPGTRFLEGKRRSRTRFDTEIAAVRRVVERLARAEVATEHEAAPLLLTLHHLVLSSQIDEYRQAVAGAAADLAPLRVATTGPWSPYAFAPEELS